MFAFRLVPGYAVGWRGGVHACVIFQSSFGGCGVAVRPDSARMGDDPSGMAELVAGTNLRQAVEQSTFIQHGDLASAEGVKYDFRLSDHVLKAKFKRPVDASKLTETEKVDLVVEPGEVVFVLTEESLNLPYNMMAQLSPKRKLSHAGILT